VVNWFQVQAGYLFYRRTEEEEPKTVKLYLLTGLENCEKRMLFSSDVGIVIIEALILIFLCEDGR